MLPFQFIPLILNLNPLSIPLDLILLIPLWLTFLLLLSSFLLSTINYSLYIHPYITVPINTSPQHIPSPSCLSCRSSHPSIFLQPLLSWTHTQINTTHSFIPPPSLVILHLHSSPSSHHFQHGLLHPFIPLLTPSILLALSLTWPPLRECTVSTNE